MAQGVKIKFDIDNKDLDIVSGKVLTLQQQIKILKQEIQKPGYSPQELELLRSKLADTEDQFKATRARSGDLITSLQLIPGPIGEIASKLNGTISLFKQFGSFNLSDLKFQFKETINDIKDVGSAIVKATGLQKLWTITTNALSGAFVRLGVAQTTAAVASRVLATALAATGIGAIVVVVGLLVGKITELVGAMGEAESQTESYNRALERQKQLFSDITAGVEQQTALDVERAKQAGKSEEEIFKIKRAGLQRQRDEAFKASNDARAESQRLFALSQTQEGERQKETLEAYNKQLERRTELDNLWSKIGQQIELADEVEKTRIAEEGRAARKKIQDKGIEDAKELAAKIKKNQEEQRKALLDGIRATQQAAAAAIAEQKASDEKKLQLQSDFNKSVRDLYNQLYTEEKDRKRAELRAAEQDELEDFTKRARQAGKSEEEIQKIRYAIKEKYRLLFSGLKTQELKDDFAKDEEARNKRLRLLELEGQGLVQGTRAYYENKSNIINEVEQAELAQLTKDYNDKKLTKEEFEKAETDIGKKYANARKDNKKQELAAIGQMVSASIDALGALTNALAGALDEEAKTSKSAFEKRKKLQVATAVMSAASGLVQILTQPSTIPSPGDWIVKGINALALGIATNTNIKKIKATEFEGGGDLGGTTPYKVTANRAAGGIVSGAGTSTSDSIPAMISNGEYVVNARATSAFLPMLNAINDYGRRPRFAMGGLVQTQSPSTILNENLTQAITETMMRPVKTYVVGQDMSSQQQFDRLIKSRSMM